MSFLISGLNSFLGALKTLCLFPMLRYAFKGTSEGGTAQAFIRWETSSNSAKECVNELHIEEEKLNFKFNHPAVTVAGRMKPAY